MAKNAIVITIEGVLQKVVTYAPIPSGIALYHSLADNYNILLITENDNKAYIDDWLVLENLTKHGNVTYNDSSLAGKTAAERRLYQVNTLRARGYAIDFVIDPDPSVSAALLSVGIPVLNFLHPSYSLPQWRPDYEEHVKPWKEIEEEAERQARLRAEDNRLEKNRLREEY